MNCSSRVGSTAILITEHMPNCIKCFFAYCIRAVTFFFLFSVLPLCGVWMSQKYKGKFQTKVSTRMKVLWVRTCAREITSVRSNSTLVKKALIKFASSQNVFLLNFPNVGMEKELFFFKKLLFFIPFK